MCFPFSDKRTKRQRTRLTHLVLASVLFDHIQAQKLTIRAVAVKCWLEHNLLKQGDLLGCDLNQGLNVKAFQSELTGCSDGCKFLPCAPSAEVVFLTPPKSQHGELRIQALRRSER